VWWRFFVCLADASKHKKVIISLRYRVFFSEAEPEKFQAFRIAIILSDNV